MLQSFMQAQEIPTVENSRRNTPSTLRFVRIIMIGKRALWATLLVAVLFAAGAAAVVSVNTSVGHAQPKPGNTDG
jgi:hypothetical protein